MRELSRNCSSALFQLRGVSQHYRKGESAVAVLDNIDFALTAGDSGAVIGASGSGKSTLLDILGLLERPIAGLVDFEGQDVMSASADELAGWRNRYLGFIFQAFNLLPRLSALDNVALPLLYPNESRQVAREAALQQLQAVGLADRAASSMAQLSSTARIGNVIARVMPGADLPSTGHSLEAPELCGTTDWHSAEGFPAIPYNNKEVFDDFMQPDSKCDCDGRTATNNRSEPC